MRIRPLGLCAKALVGNQTRNPEIFNSSLSFTLESMTAGHSGSRLYSQQLGRLSQVDHLRSGVRDQPGQY
ncbi:hypothetical protein AAY473_030873, partial [Plecturocebus cupreus]